MVLLMNSFREKIEILDKLDQEARELVIAILRADSYSG